MAAVQVYTPHPVPPRLRPNDSANLQTSIRADAPRRHLCRSQPMTIVGGGRVGQALSDMGPGNDVRRLCLWRRQDSHAEDHDSNDAAQQRTAHE